MLKASTGSRNAGRVESRIGLAPGIETLYTAGMRSLGVLFAALAMASGLFGQEPSGRFYGPLGSGEWQAKTPQRDQRQFRFQTLAPNLLEIQTIPLTCSVPLLQAQIPTDVRFTMMEAPKPKDGMAPMPRTKGPAPPCDRSSPQ